ncbi:hypothetical protein RHMOL_Rhmol04G0254300 [Rhododendron molle]|uniref:Uncharacterized protein n=1 Tax=Rhododendron molle TaxID=49168 RepID=A0ACC0P4G2_RHOML|nr:hypothetical protein RHMOL_Rhmol04G0254300 [Rhododendron molle]
MKSPTIVDLLPETPYNEQVANCCKGGVISVGAEGTSNSPKNFSRRTPGPSYTCGAASIVTPTREREMGLSTGLSWAFFIVEIKHSVVTRTHEAAVAYAAVYLIEAPYPSFLFLSSSSE